MNCIRGALTLVPMCRGPSLPHDATGHKVSKTFVWNDSTRKFSTGILISHRRSLQIHGNEIEKEGGIINIFNTGDIRFKHREIRLWEDHTIDPDHSLFLIAFSDSFVSLATSPFALPVQRDPQAQKLKNKNMTLSVPQKRIRLRKNNWADKQINDLQERRFFCHIRPSGALLLHRTAGGRSRSSVHNT